MSRDARERKGEGRRIPIKRTMGLEMVESCLGRVGVGVGVGVGPMLPTEQVSILSVVSSVNLSITSGTSGERG